MTPSTAPTYSPFVALAIKPPRGMPTYALTQLSIPTSSQRP